MSSGMLLLSCGLGSLLGPLELINSIQNKVCKKSYSEQNIAVQTVFLECP